MTTRVDAMVGLKAFIKDNPRAWAFIKEWFERDVRSGVRPSTKLYAERIRKIHTMWRGDRTYRFDNRWTAPLNRLLAAEYPEHAHLIHMREATQWDAPAIPTAPTTPAELTVETHDGTLFDVEEVVRAS